jgi:tonB-linked outer membrane protein, susC/ragA family
MPFSDIFVKALTKVSASRKAYLRHLYIKFACYEENTFVSASEVFASKSDDSRKIIPGSLRIVFRIPVPPVEIPEATASERPALRLIRRIALSLTFASSRSIPTHTRCTLIQTHRSFSDSRRPIGKAAGPNLVPNPFKFSPMIKKLLLSLSAVFCMTAASAQTQTVKGRVVDENNAPVIGATVVVKNRPTIGTSTDVKGEFALQGVPKGGGGKLQISYVGYKTQDVDIAPNIRVKLEPDAQAVEAVVVTGMTKMDKRLFTGAADQLVADDVKLAGMADISRGLEGRSAGVSVQNVSGTFGTAPKIRVRGATSIYGSSKPLWVVDGVIMEDIVDIDADDLSSGDATTLIASAIAGLNAEDIESFNILKDGSATSIYGARAMAGVIVITTKRGRAGVSTINYTGEFTYRMIPSYRDFNIMNSQDQMSVYMDMQKKGWLNLAETITDSESGVFGKMYQMIAAGQLQNDDASIGNYLRAAEFRNTNWFSELFNNNVMHTHSVSLTSGTDKSSYYASLSAMSDPGWTKTSKVERYTANINATYNIFKNLSLNLISNGSYRKQKAPGTLSSATNYVTGEVKREFDINPYSYALNTSRTLDPDEFYTRNYASFNILHELDNNYIDLSVVETKFQAELKWSPVEGLDLSALGAVKYQASIQEHNITESSNQSVAYRTVEPTTVRDNNPFLYTDPDNPYAVPVTVLPKGGIYERTDNKMLSYDFRASATYNKTFNNTHIISLYGGMSVNKIDRHNTWFRGWGLQYDMGMEPYYDYLAFKQGMESGSKYYTIGDSFYREVAFFFNGTYSYKGRYTINGTYRYEGTNKMGKSRKARWLPTWNISGAWNVHEEKFFSHVQPALSHLSLKASYSLTADRGPSYVTNSLAVIKASTPWRPTSGDTETGLKVSSLENAQLTYEKKHELNLGLDVGFVNNRINLAFDWYKRNNFDLIGTVTTQGIGGEISKYGNVAEMKSNGVEISLSTKNVQTKNFSWTTNFIYSHIHNEVTKLETSTRAMTLVSGTGFTMEGYPARSLFSFQFAGLNEVGLPVVVNTEGKLSSSSFNFQDSNENNLKTNLVYSGPVDPTDLGSFGNTFQYKGWRLNVFMTYSFGNVVRLNPVFSSIYSDLNAMPREFKNRWMVSGDEAVTNIPAIASKRQRQLNSSISYGYSAYNYSTARIAKGDFIRMKEISLSYDFPKRLISKLRFSSLSLKLQATNLFLIYADKKLNGQDPEFYNTGGVAAPVPRQFTLTIRIGL